MTSMNDLSELFDIDEQATPDPAAPAPLGVLPREVVNG